MKRNVVTSLEEMGTNERREKRNRWEVVVEGGMMKNLMAVLAEQSHQQLRIPCVGIAESLGTLGQFKT